MVETGDANHLIAASQVLGTLSVEKRSAALKFVMKFIGCLAAGISYIVLPVSADASESRPDLELVQLLTATTSTGSAAQLTTEQLKELASDFPRGSVAWPIATFLSAEVQRINNDSAAALEKYSALAEWGAENARNGSWGAVAWPSSRSGGGLASSMHTLTVRKRMLNVQSALECR